MRLRLLRIIALAAVALIVSILFLSACATQGRQLYMSCDDFKMIPLTLQVENGFRCEKCTRIGDKFICTCY